MKSDQRDQRVHILMTAAELSRLDEWRSQRQIWSRGDAIRRLIINGVEGDKMERGDVMGSKKVSASDLSGDLLAAVNTYRSSRPWFADEAEAVSSLVKDGLSLAEGREDLLELPADIVEGIREFSHEEAIESTALRMLHDALHAWRAHREAALAHRD